MYEIKQNIIWNNEAKGIFLELVQNDGNNKSFKMLPELVPTGCMPMPLTVTIFMTGSNLFPYVSVRLTAYLAFSVHACPSLHVQVSNSAYPQHSGSDTGAMVLLSFFCSHNRPPVRRRTAI